MSRTALSPDGIPVAYEAQGTGAPALVFVHGWSCDRHYWSRQLSHFSKRHQVVALDLAGHGESGAGRASWTMPAFGEDVVAVVEHLGLRQMVLIGHSMGGDVILEAALRLPGRILGLVWADTYSSLGDPQSQAEIDTFLAPFRQDFPTATRDLVRQMFLPDSDPDLVEWVAADMSAAPADIAVDAMRHSIGNEGPVIDGLRRLTASVVAINPHYRPTDAASLMRHGVSTVLMPEVGHFEMMEDPDTFSRLLTDAIAGFGGIPDRK